MKAQEATGLYMKDIEAGEVPHLYDMLAEVEELEEVLSLIEMAAKMQATGHVVAEETRQRIWDRLELIR